MSHLLGGKKAPPLETLVTQPGRGRGPAQVGFESGISPPVIATGGLGDGDSRCFLLPLFTPCGSEFLQSIPVDDSLLLCSNPMIPNGGRLWPLEAGNPRICRRQGCCQQMSYRGKGGSGGTTDWSYGEGPIQDGCCGCVGPRTVSPGAALETPIGLIEKASTINLRAGRAVLPV